MRKDREVNPRAQDFLAFALGLGKFPGSKVSEEQVRTFCKPCDYLGPDNICKRVGEQDQTRYVDRLACGWASVKSIQGTMTADGFISLENPRSLS